MSAQTAMAFADNEPSPTVIDEDHLGRMTLGDASLEREVLEIFVRQIALMLMRIEGAEPTVAAAAAHTLKGSARGIGAWRLAQAAEQLEDAVAGSIHGEAFSAATAALESACEEVSAAIRARLGDGENLRRAHG
jgi:HPt (histidine-containing phosphotransfer) domain-containing protein